MEDFGAWLIACTQTDNNARRQAEANLMQSQRQLPRQFLYELARYFTADENPEAARLLACVIFRNSILRSESRDAWVTAEAQFKETMRDHILPSLGNNNEEIARYVCIVVGALASVDLPRGQWTELIPSITRVLSNKSSIANQITMSLRTFQYICSDLENPSQLQRQQREAILSGIVKVIMRGNQIYAKPVTAEDEQISMKAFHQALKSLLEALHFIEITIQEEKDAYVIIRAVVETLGCVAPPYIKEAAMQCIQAIAEEYYSFLNESAIKLIASFTEEVLKEDQESINILILGFWEEIAEIEFKQDVQGIKHQSFSQQAGIELIKIVITEGLVGALKSVPAAEAGKPGFDGDDWNQYKASCECCLSLIKANGESVYDDILAFFKNNIRSETWQLRNASLIAFAGCLVKERSTAQTIEMIGSKLEVITDCLEDPVIEVRSSAAYTLTQICQNSASSLLDYGSEAVNHFLQKLVDHLKDEAIVSNHICRVIYDFFQAIGQHFQQKGKLLLTEEQLIFQTIQALLATAYRRDYDPDDVSLAQGAFLSLVGVVANITTEQFGNCVLVSHSEKSMIDAVANMLKNTTEEENYFPLDSTNPFHFHSSQERANFQEHLCTLLTEMFLRGAKLIDHGHYLKPMDSLIIEIFQARQEAFRQGILLLGAIALCSQGHYEEEFLRVKEYLEFAINSEDNRELVLSGCEMLSNVTEAMGESLGNHLDSLLPPIVRALESKKIFIQEKIAACEALGELAIRTGSYIQSSGKLPWVTYAEPSVQALLQLSARSFRGLQKKMDIDRRQLLFKLLSRIVETLSCIFYNSTHPAIAEALVGTIPQIFRLVGQITDTDNSLESINMGIMLVADILDIYGPQKVGIYLQQHFPRYQECANRLMSDENYKQNGLWAIQMGTCHACGSSTTKHANLPLIVHRERTQLWEKIRDFNFDAPHFPFLTEIQDQYTDLLGAYLLPDRVAWLLLQFKRYMYLVAKHASLFLEGSRSLPPSPIIDRLWRQLISNTTVYQRFCEYIFGHSVSRASQQLYNIEDYKYTIELLEEEFEEADVLLWPPYSQLKALESSHHGFLYLKVSEFISFHEEFSRDFNNFEDYEQIQTVYEQELSKLRKRTLRDVQENSLSRAETKITEFNDLSGRDVAKSPKKEIEYIEKEIRMEEDDGFETIQLVSVLREKKPRKLSGEIQEFEIKEGAVSQANISVISSAVDILEQSQIFRPYVSEPAPEDQKIKEIEVPELVLPVTYTIGSPAQHKQEFAPPQQVMIQPIIQKEESPRKSARGYSSLTDRSEVKGLQPIEIKCQKEQEVIQKILRWKLPAWTIKNLKSDLNASVVFVDRLVKEYKRFIVLHYIERCIYPHFIKLVWEYHLAETESYEEFCHKTVGYFIHSVHIPRKVTPELQTAYEQTLDIYKRVFKEEAPSQIWPSVELRFDYDSIYSFKFFNVRGYMSEVINKVELRRREERKEREFLVYRGMERAEMRERKKSIANMRVSESPERGKQYIEMPSPTKALFEGVETEETEI